MPLYEYECDKCRDHFDIRQRFHDEAVAECPKCQSKSHRVFCPAPVIFKGSGFYVTDYRKEKDPEKVTASAPSKPSEAAAKKPEAAAKKPEITATKAETSTKKSEASPAK